MNIEDLRGKTIGFAASGGLDSCTITHWLSQQGVDVVCFTGDIGQNDEDSSDAIENRMRGSGAVDFVKVDLRNEMAEMGLRVVQAQAKYEGDYWNTTGAARQVIMHGLVPAMRSKGINIFSHGATGRGNDQVRFQVIGSMIAPDLEFYAPWRDNEFLTRFRGRREMLDYCEQHSVPTKASREKPYSTDANLLGLTHEGGALESLETPSRLVTPGMGVWPYDAQDKAEDVIFRFVRGRPVEINGRAYELADLIDHLNILAGRHGIGIATNLIENRFVGVKSRGVYEAPAMVVLGQAYRQLLELILDRRARSLFDELSNHLGVQLYQGYWDDMSSQMARAGLDRVRDDATGTLSFTMYKGGLSFRSVSDVPGSLYSKEGSMEDEGSFDHRDSEGLLNILTLNARIFSHAREKLRA